MISVSEADKIISQNISAFPERNCPLEEAVGCVLREDICADRDQPPANRVTMDGIAVLFSAWEKGQKQFSIQATQKAGSTATALTDSNSCIEVMTGAVLPEGCDCVIPVEDIRINDRTACLQNGFKLKRMQNVHHKARDYRAGEVLLEKREVLTPQHIAVAAAVGKTQIKVTASPKIAVIGTGDELVEVDSPVEVHQTRQSNAFTVEAILKTNGFPVVSRFHVTDDRKQLHDSLSKILNDFDALVLSGGVSMGKFDFVPEILKELSVKVLFHKVKQRPGKPLLFGKSKANKPVFALPGNPVSTQICTYRYVLPYLRKASGANEGLAESALLSEAFEPKKELTYFIPVSVSSNSDAQLVATPIAHTGSGDYASLTKAHGFVELPAGRKSFSIGSIVKFVRW